MSKNNLNLKRRKILNESKKYVVTNGWNESLFKSITKNKIFKIDEILISVIKIAPYKILPKVMFLNYLNFF